LLVKTGLKPAGNDAEMSYFKILVFSIKRWGFQASESLTRVAGQRGGTPFGSLADLFAVAPKAPELLPLDPRSDEPAFFDDKELLGVFPPRAGDAKMVLKLTKDLLDEETQKRVKQEEAVKERVRQESKQDVEIAVKGVKATATSRNLKKDKPFGSASGDWVCRFPWKEKPEYFRGTADDVRTHLHIQIVTHVMGREQENG
jgi:hypothetical protein